ncbi:MAG TPA: amidase [Alphaproteobacteria bacterium]|nr:amidase [Alphaproteobacteria bacterium]
MADLPALMPYGSIAALGEAYRRGETGPADAVDTVLDRIGALDSQLQAFVSVDAEGARAAAADAEADLRAGLDRGPLHGVPLAVKDLCWTQDRPTTAGMAILKDFQPGEDTTVVTRLKAAGAVLLGKLKTTEGAFVGYHPDVVPPRNPWNPDRWPGVSSSGPGVATAAGLCFGALGSDTGGSIRAPSAVCGVAGLKPTYGRVSRYGIVPLADSLDHVGPMARRVLDCAAILGAIAGPDPRDPTASQAPVPDYLAAAGSDLGGITIGFDEDYAALDIDSEVAQAVGEAAAVLRDLGADVKAVRMPPLAALLRNFLRIVGVEALVAHRAWFPARADEYGPTLRGFLEQSQAVTAADLAEVQAEARRFAGAFTKLLTEVDMILCPSWPVPAPEMDADGTVPVVDESGALLKFTAPFNASGNPTLSVPCGFSRDGLPLSLQFVGRPFDEALLIRTGHAYETHGRWFTHTPPID